MAAARPASMRTDPGVMRKLNRGLVLGIAKREGPLSRADLAKSSQLAKPTVSAIVEGLLAEGLLREVGVGPTGKGGGRQPILLEFNHRSQFVVGVHIAAGTTTAVLADATGQEVGRDRVATPGDPLDGLGAISELVVSLIRNTRVARKRVAGVTVAAQLGRREVNVAEELARALKLPVVVRTVAQCVVVAEHAEGAAAGSDSAVVFLEDHGISAALLSDGVLFQGTQGIAGEIGHLRLHGVNTECVCGGRGCLEAIACGAGLARRAAEVSGSSDGTDPENVFARLAAAEDPRLHELLTEVGGELGIAASWLLNLYNPGVLIIAGGFLDAGDELLEPLRKAALESAAGQVAATVEIRTGMLGVDAPVRGAVLVALREAEQPVA
jgi:predicted NBD/HSP70 family sugar kinase